MFIIIHFNCCCTDLKINDIGMPFGPSGDTSVTPATYTATISTTTVAEKCDPKILKRGCDRIFLFLQNYMWVYLMYKFHTDL